MAERDTHPKRDDRIKSWEELWKTFRDEIKPLLKEGKHLRVLMRLHENLAVRSILQAERCDELEARIAALEARDAAGFLKYAGVYQRARSYDKGCVVTCAGSLWVAIAEVPELTEPGKGKQWQLAVPRGKDGKDKK